MSKYILLFFLILCNSIAFSQTALQRFINHPSLKHASVGISIVSLNNGKRIITSDAEKSLTPASTLKLLTTATALETLGDDYRYKTEVAIDADNPSRILVLGTGDPSLGSDAFSGNRNQFFINCVDALIKTLSKEKKYSIFVVDNLFGYDGISPEWTWIDIGNYYAAGAYGISIYDNTYRLFLNTSDWNSNPKILRTEPEIKGLTFHNFLSLNKGGGDNGYIYGAPFSYDRTLRGDIPGGKDEFSIKGDIPDPGMLLGQTLGDYLKRAGFQISNIETARNDYISGYYTKRRNAVYYRTGKVLFTQFSRPMKEIIREVNVESNNHYAEHLIRTIGRYSNNDIYSDPLDAGIEFIQEFWKEKGISTSSLWMFDGCGLAPQNGVSPQLLTDLLVYMYNKSNNAAVFFNSLPKAGQEGTLRNFLLNTKLKGKVAAKSGSIGSVQCYAGYLIDGTEKYAFTIMVNKYSGNRSAVRTAIEQFLIMAADEMSFR